MTVTVTAEKNSRFYYVDGEVKHPDRFIYLSRTTVLKAIASAGGFTDFANKRKVTLTRLNGRTFTINCKKAIQVPSLDLEVFPGDRIFVKRAIFW
jgi:polysaccharide export outer membrane protein